MPHQDDVDVLERRAALGALSRMLEKATRLLDLPGLPVSTLDGPRHNVLEAAEGGPAGAGDLLGSPALLALDRVAAPGAALCRLRGHDGG